jgi:hypothetical protein
MVTKLMCALREQPPQAQVHIGGKIALAVQLPKVVVVLGIAPRRVLISIALKELGIATVAIQAYQQIICVIGEQL